MELHQRLDVRKQILGAYPPGQNIGGYASRVTFSKQFLEALEVSFQQVRRAGFRRKRTAILVRQRAGLPPLDNARLYKQLRVRRAS